MFATFDTLAAIVELLDLMKEIAEVEHISDGAAFVRALHELWAMQDLGLGTRYRPVAA
jgi:hypothetical protein